MKPRTLAVLAALVLGLGAFIFFVERDAPSSLERAELARRILDFDADAVERVTLERAGQRTVLERREGEEAGGEDSGATWVLAEPFDYPADTSSVEDLLDRLGELQSSRALADYEPAEVGLDDPRARVTLELSDGAEQVLEVGSPVPATSSLIVRTAAGPLAYVTDEAIYSELIKPSGDWRRKLLFFARRSAIESLTLERHGRSVRLERDGDGFAVAEPINDTAATNLVEALLGAISGLRVQTFIDEPPPLSELGLEPPAARLEVRLAEGEPFVLEWGIEAAEGGAFYARHGDIVFETRAALDAALARPAQDWRSRKWMSVATYEIERLRIIDADGEIEINRVDGDWYRGEESIEYAVVSDLLYALSDAEATEVLDEVTELGEPLVEVTLTTREGDEEELTLYRQADSAALIGISSRRNAYLVLAEDLPATLIPAIQALRVGGPVPAVGPTE